MNVFARLTLSVANDRVVATLRAAVEERFDAALEQRGGLDRAGFKELRERVDMVEHGARGLKQRLAELVRSRS